MGNPQLGVPSRDPPRRHFVAEDRSELLAVICEALRNGLMLRTLRLRSMELQQPDLQPLLHVLLQEVAHRQDGLPASFPLKEVSLEGNPLLYEVEVAVGNALRQLNDVWKYVSLSNWPRGEVLPAFFAMANSHQAFSNRDVRRVFLSRFAPHDLVADRRICLKVTQPGRRARSPEEVRRTNERTLTGAL